jgi:hypothetical protein
VLGNLFQVALHVWLLLQGPHQVELVLSIHLHRDNILRDYAILKALGWIGLKDYVSVPVHASSIRRLEAAMVITDSGHSNVDIGSCHHLVLVQ